MNANKILHQIFDTHDATVGGGSASALSGAMAAGLIGMVARLSMGRGLVFEDKEYLQMAEELENLQKELIQGSEEDSKAYLLIKDAYGLKKETEEDKEKRKKAIEKAGYQASLIPKENALNCKRVLDMGEKLVGQSNKNAETDLLIGIDLAKLGTIGCLKNVQVNLPLIKNQELIQQLLSNLPEIK